MKARLTDLRFVDDILSANDLDPQPTVHLDLGIYDRSPPGVIPIVAVDLLQQTVDLLQQTLIEPNHATTYGLFSGLVVTDPEMGPEEEYGSVSWHDVRNNRYFKAHPALVHVIKARQEGIMTIPKTGRMSSTRYTQLESLFNDQVADGVDEYPEYTEKALRQAELLRLEVTMRARASIRSTAEAARVHLTAFLRALCQSAVLTRDYLRNMACALDIASTMNLPNIRAS